MQATPDLQLVDGPQAAAVLLASVTQEDVRGTLEMLRARSHERHLPAFERCASRTGRGGGRGQGRGGMGFCGGAGDCAGGDCGFCSRSN